MNHAHAIASLSAIAQPTRLSVIVALTRAGAAGMSVGDIATEVGSLPNTMSVHLTVLSRAGLVEATKRGRTSIYRANRAAIAELGGFLAGLAVGG